MSQREKIYRAALIGCGSVGSYYMDELIGLTNRTILPIGHAEVLKTHRRTTLIAGADPDRGRREAFGSRWDVPALYADHVEMLEGERPDIVSIASPPPLHARHIIDCATRGVKGIFCEKPLAPTLREADALIRACDEHGAQLCVNHIRRGDPYVRRAHDLLAEGAIGDVLTITVTWAGRLFLTGTHSFDLVNYLVGDGPLAWLVGNAEHSTEHMRVVPTQRGEDVGGTAYAVYTNGVQAFFNGRDRLPLFRTDIFGTQGMISLDDHDAQLWRQNERGTFRELLKHPFPQMMRYRAPMVALLEDLIEAIETGADPLSSGRTARRALEAIVATHYSAQHDNGKVRFPLDAPDLSPPFRWNGAGGEAIYRVPDPDGHS